MAEKKDFRELDVKELEKLRVEYKASLREMRFEKVVGSNFNGGEYRSLKKDIARINTILRETELGIGQAKETK